MVIIEVNDNGRFVIKCYESVVDFVCVILFDYGIYCVFNFVKSVFGINSCCI